MVSDKGPGAELILAIRSRDLWFDINTDIGGGFELEAKGGVVVSRSAKGISNLKKLSVSQKENGVEVIELDGTGLRKIEPYLSESVEYGVLYPEQKRGLVILLTLTVDICGKLKYLSVDQLDTRSL